MSSPAPLSAEAVRAALPEMSQLLAQVEAALGDTASPPSHTVEPDGDGVSAIKDGGGDVVARVDAETFEAVRAGVTIAIAAKHLADPDAEVITILGCNPRGRCAIEALLAIYPYAERMLAYDPDVKRQEHFADDVMTAFELASIIPPEPYEAVVGAQILVTAMPAGGEAMIEPDWLQTGTLCVLLDGVTSFTPAALDHADRVLTDDAARHDAAGLAGMPSAEADLAAVVSGSAPGRGDGVPTIVVASHGSPLIDAALARAIVSS